MDAARQPQATCSNCGSAEVRTGRVRSAFWDGDRLVVVEGIPALVCSACAETFYDDATVVELDQLRGAGFPPEKARAELRVPVFSFDDRAIAKSRP
jgi:YgiT-type zinc finger domain-containing protein